MIGVISAGELETDIVVSVSTFDDTAFCKFMLITVNKPAVSVV